MIECVNCGKEVPKYKTHLDTNNFFGLDSKAEKMGKENVRICEECYDELTSKIETKTDDSHVHPFLRSYDESEAKS